MPETQEQWEPVQARDVVFNSATDGRVIIAAVRGNAVFGAIVRKRDGRWMRRQLPLVILNGPEVQDKWERKDYVAGNALPN